MSARVRFSRHVPPEQGPRADPEHAGGIISQVARECFGFPLDTLEEVAGEMEVCASLLRLPPP